MNTNTIDVNLTRQAVHDKLESQIKTAEAKLDTLKTRAESTKAHVEIKAIKELLTKQPMLQHKLQELKKSGEDHWEHAKADLEARVGDFENSVKEIALKIKTH